MKSSAPITFGLFLAILAVGTEAAGEPGVRRALPVPDLPGFKSLKGDFHVHTVFSDGLVWPTVRVEEAWRDGLDVISLTDHVEYHPHQADVKTDGARSYEIARPLAEQLGLILIPGVEITKTLEHGPAHFNALFVTDVPALHVPNLYEALRRARSQKAFVFWNHPAWEVPRAEWFPGIATAYDEKLFQGMELVNGSEFYSDAYPWIEDKKLTIFANSDIHDAALPRSLAGIRTITLLFARTADAAGVREALEARRTAAWMGGEVWGAEQHLAGLWEGAVTVENPQLSVPPGASQVLRVRNTSAVAFNFRTRRSPAWFALKDGRVAAEGTSPLRISLSKEAPAGVHRIMLELEITNLHTGPKSNLTVRLPLSVQVSEPAHETGTSFTPEDYAS